MERVGKELEGVQALGWLGTGSCVRNSRTKVSGGGLEASKDP